MLTITLMLLLLVGFYGVFARLVFFSEDGLNSELEQFAVDTWRPSGPGDFHPESLTDSGLDTLASSGSCHRLKAAAFR